MEIQQGNNLVLTYHEACKKVTCICGVVIERCHTCSIPDHGPGQGPVSSIEFRVCQWDRRTATKGDIKVENPPKSQKEKDQACRVCQQADNFQKYLDSTYTDEDGYEFCSFCHNHSHVCSCIAYIDRDGEEKCKRCDNEWTGFYLDDGECDVCGYEGGDD